MRIFEDLVQIRMIKMPASDTPESSASFNSASKITVDMLVAPLDLVVLCNGEWGLMLLKQSQF